MGGNSKMLNVIRVGQTVVEDIQVDPYIPVKIKWGKWKLTDEQTIYWRIGDLKKSLLEIGIASKTGSIRSLTVIHTDKIFLDSRKFDCQAPSEIGTPIFKVSRQVNYNKVDDYGIFEIHYNDDGEVNLLVSRNEITKRVFSGRVCFGLDFQSNVCLINISSLTEDENVRIKDTLEFMCKQNTMK